MRALRHPLLRRPLAYAHRGGAGLRPENTLAAFEHGLAAGADGLELDVRLTRDGVVIVHHDAHVERTTDGRGDVAELTLDDLQALDAGYRFAAADGSFPYRGRGVRIPTLREVLGRCPEAALIVELKTGSERLAHAVLDELHAAGALPRAAVGAFSTAGLRSIRRREPRLRTGAAREETRWALYRTWVRWPHGTRPYAEFQVPERSGRTRIVTPAFVAHAHRAGLLVKVWTVNERADMDRLLAWGVDAIISDYPDVAAAACRAYTGLASG